MHLISRRKISKRTMLLYGVILMLSTCFEAQSNDELTKIVKVVLDHSLAGKSTIIYYANEITSPSSNVNHFVEAALMRMESKSYIVVSVNNTLETYRSMAHVAVFQENIEIQNMLQYIPDHILGESIRVVIFSSENCSKCIPQFENVYPLGTEIILASFYVENNSSDESVCVYLAWNKKSSCANNSIVLNFSLEKIFDKHSWRPKPKKAVTVETFTCPPFVHYDEVQGKYTGIEYNILQEITKDWHIVLNIDSDSSNATSKWNYIVESLLQKKADVAMCSLWLNSLVYLFPNISITYPLINTCATLLVPKPQLLPDISYVFQPVQFNLWIFLMVFILVNSLIFRLFSQSNTYKRNFFYYVFNTVRVFTSGSLPKTPSPNQYALRYILISFSLTSLLLSTAYSAGFISLLTYPRLAKPVLCLEDVVNMDIKIDTEVRDVETFPAFLRKFENPHIKKMASLVISSDLDKHKVMDRNNFARFVKLIGQKYVSDTDMLDEDRKTHLRLLKECLFESYSSFALQRHSKYTPFFNKMLMRLNEHGFITHWYWQSTINPRYNYMNNFFSSYVSESTEHVSFDVSKLKGVFLLLGVGLMLALLVFLCEVQMH